MSRGPKVTSNQCDILGSGSSFLSLGMISNTCRTLDSVCSLWRKRDTTGTIHKRPSSTKHAMKPRCSRQRRCHSILAFLQAADHRCATVPACPSCHQKKTLLTGIHVAEDVCFPVAHRQVVFTIPKRLRTVEDFSGCADRRIFLASRPLTGYNRSADGEIPRSCRCNTFAQGRRAEGRRGAPHGDVDGPPQLSRDVEHTGTAPIRAPRVAVRVVT